MSSSAPIEATTESSNNLAIFLPIIGVLVVGMASYLIYSHCKKPSREKVHDDAISVKEEKTL